MEAPKVQRRRGRDRALPVGGAAGGWAEWVRPRSREPLRSGLRAHAAPLQVDMLYEEALYTVLHRAGTMGPDQVDDEEALLSYLQQVRPGPRPLGWPGPSLGVAETLSPTCLCHCRLNNTHRIAPRTSHTHRCTGMPRKMDRHTDTFKQKNTQTDGHSCKEHWKRQVDRCRTHTEGWTDTQRKAERTNQQVDRPLSSAVCAPPTP